MKDLRFLVRNEWTPFCVMIFGFASQALKSKLFILFHQDLLRNEKIFFLQYFNCYINSWIRFEDIDHPLNIKPKYCTEAKS